MKEHKNYLNTLMRSSLDSYTKKRFAEQYLYIQNLVESTKVEFSFSSVGVIIDSETIPFKSN